MRTLLVVAATLALALSPAFAKSRGSSGGKVHVKTYTTKTGKVVEAHDRTTPNKTKGDNWSAKGNVNPETGKGGTKNTDEK